MTGHHPRRSTAPKWALLLVLWPVPLACAERELDDGMADEPVEQPPELLARHERACEDWCLLVDECERDESLCKCEDRDFSEEHVLCVEKATLRLECQAALTCDEIDLLYEEKAQDRRCFGENLAETAACSWD